HIQSGNAVDIGQRLRQSKHFKAPEEECSVLAVVQFRQDHRPAQVDAEVVQLVFRDYVTERVGGIEGGVLNVLEDATVEFIGARLGNRGNVGDAPELGWIEVFADLDFFDGVEGRKHLRQRAQR